MAAIDIKNQVNAQIVAALEASEKSGVKLPWRRPWKGGLHRNPSTGTVYRPLLQLLLASAGYDDPRWYGPGWCIQNGIGFKGAKKTYIPTYFVPKEPEEADDAQSQPIVEGPKSSNRFNPMPRLVMQPLFNGSMLTGIPDLAEELGLAPIDPIVRIEAFIQELVDHHGLCIEHGGLSAFYDPTRDVVRVPKREFFKSAVDYYATILHEIGHWTGHESRCARDLSGMFGTPKYAGEELVAEPMSAYLMGMLGGDAGQAVSSHVQHAAYIQSWIKLLRDDKDAFFNASALAMEGVEFLIACVPWIALDASAGPAPAPIAAPMPAAPMTVESQMEIFQSIPEQALRPTPAPRRGMRLG